MSQRSMQRRRLANLWTDDPSNPGRASASNPHVQRLVKEIDAHGCVTDLGGTMSLNLLIHPASLVLRVHQPFISRRRLLAVQAVRLDLARRGLIVPVPVEYHGSKVVRCDDRWSELENYVPHEPPEVTPASYAWMFNAMGSLHGALASIDLPVPRPLVATFASPGSLRRWLRVTDSAVRQDPESQGVIRRIAVHVQRLRQLWSPAARLPRHLVHGDVRLGNVCRGPEGAAVYLDFGFLAVRPRIHDLAYSVAFMILALGGHKEPARFRWDIVPPLLEEYATAGARPLIAVERDALAPYTAAVPLYFSALAGFMENPVRRLQASLPFLRLSEWLLTHPAAVLGG